MCRGLAWDEFHFHFNNPPLEPPVFTVVVKWLRLKLVHIHIHLILRRVADSENTGISGSERVTMSLLV